MCFREVENGHGVPSPFAHSVYSVALFWFGNHRIAENVLPPPLPSSPSISPRQALLGVLGSLQAHHKKSRLLLSCANFWSSFPFVFNFCSDPLPVVSTATRPSTSPNQTSSYFSLAILYFCKTKRCRLWSRLTPRERGSVGKQTQRSSRRYGCCSRMSNGKKGGKGV